MENAESESNLFKLKDHALVFLKSWHRSVCDECQKRYHFFCIRSESKGNKPRKF